MGEGKKPPQSAEELLERSAVQGDVRDCHSQESRFDAALRIQSHAGEVVSKPRGLPPSCRTDIPMVSATFRAAALRTRTFRPMRGLFPWVAARTPGFPSRAAFGRRGREGPARGRSGRNGQKYLNVARLHDSVPGARRSTTVRAQRKSGHDVRASLDTPAARRSP